MEPSTTQMFKPGRLSVTCRSAQNIRARINSKNSKNDNISSPHLVFKLNGTEYSTTNTNSNQVVGHDVLFNDEIISFDITQPNENDVLEIELRDNENSIGKATYSISNVLLSPTGSGEQNVTTLPIMHEGDVTTNSVVNLFFSFVQAKHGVIKLSPSLQNVDGNANNMYALVTTPDGQSKKTVLANNNNTNVIGIWIDESNTFDNCTIQLYSGTDNSCIGSGELSLLSCLNGTEVDNATSYVALSSSDTVGSDNNNSNPQKMKISHWFLEAGVVQVESISTTNLYNSPTNQRIVFKTDGKSRSTTTMTSSAGVLESNSIYSWNEEAITLSVVDEYTLTVECCDYDDISGDHEMLGSAEVSLLPLFKTGRLDVDLNLILVTDGETLNGGQVSLSLSFTAPKNHAYPKDQLVPSYVVGQSDDVLISAQQEQTKRTSMDVDGIEIFSEESIQKAFNLFDLDSNGYIGVAELKHILILMGELVTDEEVDMMISMLDLNGDGQVSFLEFKAMVESPDPSNDDFLEKKIYSPSKNDSALLKQQQQKRDVFMRTVQTANMDKDDVYRMLKTIRDMSPSSRNLSHEEYQIGYEDLCQLMPTVLGYSRSDCRQLFTLLCSSSSDSGEGGSDTIDSRNLIMTYTNFVPGFQSLEERCKLAFDMYDVDRSGYLSLDEVEAMMTSTNLLSRDLVKKRAENFMNCADTDMSGGITIDELIVAAEKLPNLLYPSHTKK